MSLSPTYAPIPFDRQGRRGPFVVLEGVSGVGKSTLAGILAERLGGASLHTLTAPHVDWSAQAANQLRPLPQFAFYLSGLLHVSDRVRRALTGGPLIADRYTSSVVACHAAAHGIDTAGVSRLLEPFRSYLTVPDHTFYLRCSESALRERMRSKRDLKKDDTDLFEVPGRLKQLLKNFESEAAADSTAIILDTDHATPNELASQITARLEAKCLTRSTPGL
ncbi:dTMP kinase [Streptomyces sp. NPDC059209]|uniref:dTMP kinase n=1 Tax=Streptomyces sp. NPDC059209 TaxID=3346769 RepID=UPI00369B47F1